MTPDESYALLLLAFLLITITQKHFTSNLLEMFLSISRPGATVVLLGFLAFLYSKDLHYTFLIFALLSIFLLKDIWTYWVRSDARRLYLEVGRDNERFDPLSSIDIQMANGDVTHSSPSIYHKDTQLGLLVFPPSESTLKEMNG